MNQFCQSINLTRNLPARFRIRLKKTLIVSKQVTSSSSRYIIEERLEKTQLLLHFQSVPHPCLRRIIQREGEKEEGDCAQHRGDGPTNHHQAFRAKRAIVPPGDKTPVNTSLTSSSLCRHG